MKQVSSTEANRDFSKLLRAVAEGQPVQITSRGRAVAVMLPAAHRAAGRLPAVQRLLSRLDAQHPSRGTARTWVRDELYD